MSSTPSQSYPLGGTSTERDRLLSQAEQYESTANWLLDQIGVQNGWRAVDIGCGPIGILNLLSQRVGPSGTVIGLEREQRFVEMARAEIAKRGLGNVTMVQGDGLNTSLEKGSFDLVHERLVLINVSAREAFLTEMLSLLRPGGTVALEDVDNVSWLCQPAHPSWDILLNAFHTVFHAGGRWFCRQTTSGPPARRWRKKYSNKSDGRNAALGRLSPHAPSVAHPLR